MKLIVGTDETASIQHGGGTSMLIQMKGPNDFEESFAYEMLTALRGKIVSHLKTSNTRLFQSRDVANVQSRSLTVLPVERSVS